MPRTCTICGHKKRAAIEKAVLAGDALRAIAGRWSVSQLRDLTLPRNPVHSSTKASVERADDSRSIEVSMSPGRDYAALVELLSQLSRVPDGLGETRCWVTSLLPPGLLASK